LEKVVGGAVTNLGSSTTNFSANEVIRVEADGSSITGRINGATNVGPITDTAIAGNLRCGIFCYLDAAGSSVQLDSFEAGDLVLLPTRNILKRTYRPAPFAPGLAR
jgi:hypothetical protein